MSAPPFARVVKCLCESMALSPRVCCDGDQVRRWCRRWSSVVGVERMQVCGSSGDGDEVLAME
ncbi:hypothetical protein E2C01_064406 [Portunus trituberculatus]|uniref:Uncharacterized protein n=1 Tax=Portunus trituberculatus TaxID=210409 RepID=A0A5B7HJP2_PORTR|nr:hypothetical protein [Portunus trituberculatus]